MCMHFCVNCIACFHNTTISNKLYQNISEVCSVCVCVCVCMCVCVCVCVSCTHIHANTRKQTQALTCKVDLQFVNHGVYLSFSLPIHTSHFGS